MIGAYGYYKLIDSNQQLANIGLVSFAAVIQFLPAFLFALFWRGAHSKGVFWGLIGGFSVWAYTLILPTILSTNMIVGVFGNSIFHPQKLFGFNLDNSLTHGVFWSLGINLLLIIVSKSFKPVDFSLPAHQIVHRSQMTRPQVAMKLALMRSSLLPSVLLVPRVLKRCFRSLSSVQA